MSSLYSRLRDRLAKVEKTFIRHYANYHAQRGTAGRVFHIPGRGYRMWLPISWGKTVAQRRFGRFEPWTFRALERSVQPGATVLEIGACYGEFTIYLSSLVGRSGRVYAFELLPKNFEILTRNVELNRLDNVECFHRGVAASGVTSVRIAPDPAHLYQALGQISDRRYPIRPNLPAATLVDVPCVALSNFLFEPGRRRVDYLFMDIEACEVQIFTDIEPLLRAAIWRPTIYMETHPQFYKPGDTDYLRTTLAASRYRIETIGNHWLCTPEPDRIDVLH